MVTFFNGRKVPIACQYIAAFAYRSCNCIRTGGGLTELVSDNDFVVCVIQSWAKEEVKARVNADKGALRLFYRVDSAKQHSSIAYDIPPRLKYQPWTDAERF